jgi:hypothetical protein
MTSLSPSPLSIAEQLIIDGREAIPVRRIPLITSDIFDPQTLAGILAHKLKANGFPLIPDFVNVVVDGKHTSVPTTELIGARSREIEVYAYYVNEDGKPVKMQATEWDRIFLRLSTLENRFRKQEEESGLPDDKFHDWYREALKILPGRVFLWKDDVAALWSVYHSQTEPLADSRDDELRINFEAYIDHEFCCLDDEDQIPAVPANTVHPLTLEELSPGPETSPVPAEIEVVQVCTDDVTSTVLNPLQTKCTLTAVECVRQRQDNAAEMPELIAWHLRTDHGYTEHRIGTLLPGRNGKVTPKQNTDRGHNLLKKYKKHHKK